MHFNRKKVYPGKAKIRQGRSRKKNVKKTDSKKSKDIKVSSKKKVERLKIKASPKDSIKHYDRLRYKPLSLWNSLLKGHPAFILGNAPSISKQNLHLLDPYLTIGVNRIFYIYSPTILMWQDIQMWNTERMDIGKQDSIKICSSTSDPRNHYFHFKVRQGKFKFGKKPELLHGWGNTSALAAQIAVNLGCSALILLGTDCKYDKKKNTDFYGVNKDHKPYTLEMCNDAMNWLKYNCSIPIYNCSDNKLWPKKNLADVIKKIRPKKMSKKKFLKMFRK